jgi:hypothetical protein
MRIRTGAAAVLAAAAFLAGCSGSPGSADAATPSVTASADARLVEALRAVSRCMRSHGHPDFPDATEQPDGRWNWPPSLNGVFRSTTACEQVVVQAKTLMGGSDPQKVDAASMAQLRRYAQCMRERGVTDWPDPGPSGTFKLPQRLRPAPGEPKEVARFAAQDRACRRFAPADGIRLDG